MLFITSKQWYDEALNGLTYFQPGPLYDVTSPFAECTQNCSSSGRSLSCPIVTALQSALGCRMAGNPSTGKSFHYIPMLVTFCWRQLVFHHLPEATYKLSPAQLPCCLPALHFHWSFCLAHMRLPLSQTLSCSWPAVGEKTWEIIQLIYCHQVSENLLDILFSFSVCDFVFWFSSSSFSQILKISPFPFYLSMTSFLVSAEIN